MVVSKIKKRVREREDILIAYVKRERENKINCKLNYCVKKNLLSHMR